MSFLCERLRLQPGGIPMSPRPQNTESGTRRCAGVAIVLWLSDDKWMRRNAFQMGEAI